MVTILYSSLEGLPFLIPGKARRTQSLDQDYASRLYAFNLGNQTLSGRLDLPDFAAELPPMGSSTASMSK